MSATRHLQPGLFKLPAQEAEQLAMFIPAHELVESGEYGSVDFGRKMSAGVWSQVKREASVNSPMTMSTVESVRKYGIQRPANIGHRDDGGKEIGNGHHRIASAHMIDRAYEVPVLHHDAYYGEHTQGGYQHEQHDIDDYTTEEVQHLYER